MRLVTGYPRAALLALSLAGLAACSSPETAGGPAAAGQVLVVDDFESEQSLGNWEGPVSLSAGKATHGKSALALDLSDRRARDLSTVKLPADLSGFDQLRFDIFNPTGRVQLGSIMIQDEPGLAGGEAEFSGQAYRGNKIFMNPGWNHYELLLDRLRSENGNRAIALDKIKTFALSFGGIDDTLYLDNFRLVKGEEGAATASKVAPTDCRVVIDNRYSYPQLAGDPAKVLGTPELKALEDKAHAAVQRLESLVGTAELQGYSPLYWKIPLVTAQLGLEVRSRLVWFQNERSRREILEYVISACTVSADQLEGILSGQDMEIIEEPEDDVNPHPWYAPPYPDFSTLTVKDGFFRDAKGDPVIILSMLLVDQGPLTDYFATWRHRQETYTVGGGSRYDIEESPVYEAFHKYPDTHRVGWDGWCGHLIKDQWSMGGKKENVVICLESPHTRAAVLEYIEDKSKEWMENKDLLYNIQAYELMYICYCETSQRMFRDWLRREHGSIGKVNELWGTNYASFEEIRAPETKNGGPLPDVNRAAWYDWAGFNTRRFTDYLKWNKEQIRRFDPRLPICAGGTSSMLSSANGTSGIDEEQIINEVDDVILNESGHSHIFSDLLSSLSETPKPMCDPEMGGDAHNILLHFLHGKSAITKWWWARTISREHHGMDGSSLAHSWEIPLEEVEEVLRLGLDVRRLNHEIAAFSAPAPEVAILYSQTSILQVPPQLHRAGATPYLQALYDLWEGSRCLGRPGGLCQRAADPLRQAGPDQAAAGPGRQVHPARGGRGGAGLGRAGRKGAGGAGVIPVRPVCPGARPTGRAGPQGDRCHPARGAGPG